MGHLVAHIDSFTGMPFAGNPAAVVLLGGVVSDKWMQSIAAEMNLSETVFIQKTDSGFYLRWFTPTVEVGLCGHATLAAAYFLWNSDLVSKHEKINFGSVSGSLSARIEDGWIELDFPSDEYVSMVVSEAVLSALNLGAEQVLYVGKRNIHGIIVEVDSAEIVRSLKPDFQAMKKLEYEAVLVTARDISGEYDFVSRFFGPNIGMDEDPVTGAAHTCLGPYWASKLGKNEFRAYQASKRGGELKLKVEGARTKLFGQAVLISRGEILI